MELVAKYDDQTLKLRTAISEDASYLLKWWNDGDIMAHAGFPLGLNITEEQVLKNIVKSCETKQLLIMQLDGIPFGEMSYTIDGNNADFGIKICIPTMRGQGIGELALTTLFEYLFSLGIEKITCDTNLNNKGSQNFYENKMGMRKVKVCENCWKNQLGELQSTVFFEITKNEFEQTKNPIITPSKM